MIVLFVLVVSGGATHLLRVDERPAPSAPMIAVRAKAPEIPVAAPAPEGLPVVDYWTAPRGFPADPTPSFTAGLAAGLRPTRSLPVYDAPGGKARARVHSEISGMRLVLPIVERRPGWTAVLLPTVNRRIGWLPARGWTAHPLRDHLLVQRRKHRLTWLRDGVRQAAWTVSVGTRATPTPLGRTFVLGRTSTSGSIYAGVDALALGSVPERRVPSGAHTGIHAWFDPGAFGRSASNGCVRMPAEAQRKLVRHIGPGTTVTVID